MAEISSIFQGLSIDELVSRYSAGQKKPVNNLKAKKTRLTRKSAVITDFKSQLKTLKTTSKRFTSVGSLSKLKAKSALSSNVSIFTAEANSTANTGINTIFVSRIARNDIGISNVFSKNSKSLASKLGDYIEFSIQVGSNKSKTISINIDKSEDDDETILNRIAEAINDEIDGVTANVIKSSKNNVRLTLTAEDSGSENAITLTGAGDSEALRELGFLGGDSSRIAATGNSGGFVVADTAELDAEVKINGIDITSSSNTLTDIIRGVTINIRKAQEAGETAETLTISENTDEIVEQIESFIEDYNETLDFITSKISVNSESGARGALAGDFTYTKFRLNLREIVSGAVEGVDEGNPSMLTEIGITINTDGTLSLDDKDELIEVIRNDPDAISDMFSVDNGFAVQLTDLIERYGGTGKTLDDNISSIQNQIQTTNRQIEQFESRIKLFEESLRRKFVKLEKTLILLNSQQRLLELYGFSSGGLIQFRNFGLFGQR